MFSPVTQNDSPLDGTLQPRPPLVRPDWAIYSTLGNFLKPVATIILPKSPTHFRHFYESVKIFHFSS